MAAHYGVPIILVSGDDVTVQEAEIVAPAAEKIVVKHSLGRFAAAHIHPTRACELLRAGAQRAVERLARGERLEPPSFKLPVQLEVTFLVADMAEMVCSVRGVERTGTRTVRLSGDNLLNIYRQFVAVVVLARALADR